MGRHRGRSAHGNRRAATRPRLGLRALPAVLAVVLAAMIAGAWPRAAAADSPPTLRVDPATQSVSPGQTFVVSIVQSATVETTGAQADFVFDPALLQLKGFELGPAYTAANAVFQFGSADVGTNGQMDKVVARANKWGNVQNAAGFLLPGSGVIPAGDTVFLKVTFAVVAGASGQATLGIFNGSMIDGEGKALVPQFQNGAVTVGPGVAPGASGGPGASGAPAASGDPGASQAASAEPSVPATMAPATLAPPVAPTTPVDVRVAPTSLTLKSGDTARVFLIANADGNLSSAVADLHFDASRLTVTGVEVGPPWAGATAIAVATDKSKRGIDGAIAEANTTGLLQAVGAFYPPGVQDLPYGETIFVSVLVQAKADGAMALSLGNATALGPAGETLAVSVAPDSLAKAPDKPIALDLTVIVPLALLLVAGVGAVALAKSGRIPVRVRRRWPFYLSLALGMIPVALFAGLVALIVVQAAPIVAYPGIPALFGVPVADANGAMVTTFSLIPALWGTMLITAIAAMVALPVSLVLAIVAVDFPMGPIGRFVRPVIGILSGVPPVVYAVSVPVFVMAVMIPKFAGNMDFSAFQNGGPAAIGANPATWPPDDVPYSAGGFPWDLTGPSSTLLGGLLVGLFLIPFVTPLFADALRDVPRAAREGSLALGANRTYTLRRVVLPRALPAIAGASTLAVLKAMGDAVIVLFAVGISAAIPNPPFDVLERATSIGAWGSNLIGSFDVLDQSCTPANCALGYTGALGLLLVAAVVVVLMTYLQARGRRRVAA